MPQQSLFNVIDGEVVHQKCTACDLANNKALITNCMDGVGPPGSDLMFVGMSPADLDDKEGRPMTGKGGQLFRDFLAQAGVNSHEVFITNCIKCCTYKKEISKQHWAACQNHLRTELNRIKPQAIVAVGSYALWYLTGQWGIQVFRRKGVPCLLNPDVLVFTIQQPAAIWHAKSQGRADNIRGEIISDMRWLKDKAEKHALVFTAEEGLDYKIARTVQDVRNFLDEMDGWPELACDLETGEKSLTKGQMFPSDTGVITAIGFSKRPKHSRAVPMYCRGEGTLFWWDDQEYELVKMMVGEFLKRNRVYGANFLQFDQKWIDWTFDIPFCNVTWDTQQASYIIRQTAKKHGLETLTQKYTDIPPWKSTFQMTETEKLCKYLCRDTDATLRVKEAEEKEMSDGQKWLLKELMIPLGHELKQAEYRGVKVSTDVLTEAGSILGNQIDEDVDWMRSLPEVKAFEVAENTTFNPLSQPQLRKVMGNYLNMPKLGKTAKGDFSTADWVLEALGEYPFVRKIQAVRRRSKLKGTYVDGIVKRMDRNHILHTTYKQDFTDTGRLVSRDPNLQNIPRKDTAGRVLADGSLIKKEFIPRDGYKFLQMDYSQAELRVLAMYSKDPALIAAFHSGFDIHKAVAAPIYGVDVNKVTEAQRNAAKTVNFGIIYGRSLDTMIKQFVAAAKEEALKSNNGVDLLHVEAQATDRARQFYHDHQRRYPLVWNWIAEQIRQIKAFGIQWTLFCRARHYDIDYIGPHEERVAMNFPIQSSASDLTLFAIVRIMREIRRRGLDAHLVLTVHDSLVLEVRPDDFWEVAILVKEIAENPGFEFVNVPMKADIEIGDSWGTLKKVNVETQEIAA